jgi:cytochrome oxidase Cu insertion factor (SCO1/SenC/PrrC family)
MTPSNETLSVVAHAIGYAQFYSRSHRAVIHVYDDAGNVIETYERKGDFKEPCSHQP